MQQNAEKFDINSTIYTMENKFCKKKKNLTLSLSVVKVGFQRVGTIDFLNVGQSHEMFSLFLVPVIIVLPKISLICHTMVQI